jgi:dienelactone hydrolase
MKPLACPIAFLLSLVTISWVTISWVTVSRADGPADNNPDAVRPVPPIGIELTASQQRSLEQRCQAVREAWQRTVASAEAAVTDAKRWQKAAAERTATGTRALAPEVLVFPRAVELALEFQQFYRPADVDAANELLDEALRRIEVAAAEPVWGRVVGLGGGARQQLIVGGFRSEIDGSFQPYALVVPPGVTGGDGRPRRLDIWFHGRGEKLSEVNFLQKGRHNPGRYTPADTLVLHPYGRYSNAFKFAGEVDVLEALRYVRSRLPVDGDRISVRGFSMGGAACWQFATHYADRFFAANPGAGFSETPEFLKSFQGEDLSGTPHYQRTLWRLYDCPPWSRNLVHCPTVAYSGEIDRQKQAADVMEAALAEHGIDLVHVIGPDTAHNIHPDSKVEIERRMDSLASRLATTSPRRVDFTTYTLRYHRMHWVDLRGLDQHWQRASVQATRQDDGRIDVATENVSRLRLEFAPGEWDGEFPCRVAVQIDGDRVEGGPVRSDRSWRLDLDRRSGRWQAATAADSTVRKRPGLQGPIDDAFMGSFLFVLPSGESSDPVFQAWVDAEAEHAQRHWRKHFRGDVRSVIDHELTKQQIDDHHLVLFGDPESNSVIARLADGLPVQWTGDAIRLGDHSVPRRGHAAALIFPNPVNPDRYVVLNSGFTYREYDYLNNARQTPKLPDWALFDVSDGATPRSPGQVSAAGFFDERWKP